MNRVRALLAGFGFVITGFLLSAFVPADLMPSLQMFRGEIFRTNCLLIFGLDIKDDRLPELSQNCVTIQQLIPALLMANGVILVLFGMTKWCAFISIFTLSLLVCFYSNPIIDSSMRNYSHFLKILICIASIFVAFFRKDESDQQSKAKQN